MKPAILDLNEASDWINKNTDMLAGTFLTPEHLLCIGVTVLSESMQDPTDDDIVDRMTLTYHVSQFVPVANASRVVAIVEMIHNDLAQLITPQLSAAFIAQDMMPCKLYAYPVLRGMVVVTDEDNHEECYQRVYSAVWRAAR